MAEGGKAMVRALLAAAVLLFVYYIASRIVGQVVAYLMVYMLTTLYLEVE